MRLCTIHTAAKSIINTSNTLNLTNSIVLLDIYYGDKRQANQFFKFKTYLNEQVSVE